MALPEDFIVMDSYSKLPPLPKNWPCNVKNAVLHIISLALGAVALRPRGAVPLGAQATPWTIG